MRGFAALFRTAAAGACAAVLALASGAAAGAPKGQAYAQGYGAPPADVGGDDAAASPDATSQLVRIDRLESQMRQMNGEIEQLQFENRKLEDQLKKFQEDVDFRFQDKSGGAASPAAPARPQKRSESIDSLAAPDDPAAAASPARPGKRADAFDPASDPNAPGAPHPLGSPDSAAPPARARTDAEPDLSGPDAPLDLSGAKLRQGRDAATNPGGAAPPAPAGAPPAVAALTTPNATAGTPINPLKEEFDVAYGYFRQKEYETAEKGFTAFIQKNPKSRMTADATYYLGESFFQRNRPREAAEQYLKISTQFATSQHAPEALLRLGQSLSALGAREQACATFAEVPRKYPNAAAGIKAGADREAKRAQC